MHLPIKDLVHVLYRDFDNPAILEAWSDLETRKITFWVGIQPDETEPLFQAFNDILKSITVDIWHSKKL